MKIKCSKKELLQTLAVTKNVIAVKNSLAVLSNILIEAKDQKLTIFATDCNCNFISVIDVVVEKEGKVLVNNKDFSTMIKKISGDEIEIKVNDENIITINNGFNLKGIDTEKYPIIHNIKKDINFSIKQDMLFDMINKVIFISKNTNERKFVRGIYLVSDKDSIQMVSTDGKRLAIIKKEIDLSAQEIKGIIIPFKILSEINKILKVSKNKNLKDVYISISNKDISIRIENYIFSSNFIEGTFPPYGRVIPTDNVNKFTVNKDILYKTIDRISQFSDKEAPRIKFNITNNTLKIFSENVIVGYGEEIIECQYQGEEYNLALNYIQVMDIISVIENENIVFNFKDAQNTITILEENNDEYIYLVMPMIY